VLEARARQARQVPSFSRALRGTDVGIIAEIKRRSPSRGEIRPGIPAVDQAEAYKRGGAAAVSVLTELVHFGGKLEDLEAVSDSLGIPALRKDFHVDVTQLFEAKAAGASAALLIARAVTPRVLRNLIVSARHMRLESLVEVRDEAELELALSAGAEIIGVNNRDLETLEIDETTCARLIPLIPRDRIAIAESGMATRADVEAAAAAGADAALVGSAVSAADDPTAAVRSLVGVPRSGNARRG
jgi:indole-3-glycerol phosphate synthase